MPRRSIPRSVGARATAATALAAALTPANASAQFVPDTTVRTLTAFEPSPAPPTPITDTTLGDGLLNKSLLDSARQFSVVDPSGFDAHGVARRISPTASSLDSTFAVPTDTPATLYAVLYGVRSPRVSLTGPGNTTLADWQLSPPQPSARPYAQSFTLPTTLTPGTHRLFATAPGGQYDPVDHADLHPQGFDLLLLPSQSAAPAPSTPQFVPLTQSRSIESLSQRSAPAQGTETDQKTNAAADFGVYNASLYTHATNADGAAYQLSSLSPTLVTASGGYLNDVFDMLGSNEVAAGSSSFEFGFHLDLPTAVRLTGFVHGNAMFSLWSGPDKIVDVPANGINTGNPVDQTLQLAPGDYRLTALALTSFDWQLGAQFGGASHYSLRMETVIPEPTLAVPLLALAVPTPRRTRRLAR